MFIFLQTEYIKNNTTSVKYCNPMHIQSPARPLKYTFLKYERNSRSRLRTRVYFRFQGKHPTFSKRASYLGNTSWPDSPKLMKVLVTIGSNKLLSLYIRRACYCFYSFLYPPGDFENTDSGRNRNLEVFYLIFFKNLTGIPSLNCKITASKTPVSSFCEYIFFWKRWT